MIMTTNNMNFLINPVYSNPQGVLYLKSNLNLNLEHNRRTQGYDRRTQAARRHRCVPDRIDGT